MKNLKSFLAKNFLILAFAIGGIFAVTSNVAVSGNNMQHTTGTGTGGGITCNGPAWNWGDCLYCVTTRVNDPYFGPSICYSCNFSGWMEDYCPYSCSEGCMTL